MSRIAREDLIEVLACEIESRPEAPGPDALAPFITGAALAPRALTLAIDRAGRAIAEAFVAAEQVCCADIGWVLEDKGGLRLSITAAEQQLKVLAGLVPADIEIEKVQ
jgi:hypothetical protein